MNRKKGVCCANGCSWRAPWKGGAFQRVAKTMAGSVPGDVKWRILEAYNDVLRDMAAQERVAFIDLAHRLPKESSLFYDPIHFNLAGQQAVAEIVEQAVAADIGLGL